MANYYNECKCGRFTDAKDKQCPVCVGEERDRLVEALVEVRKHIRHGECCRWFSTECNCGYKFLIGTIDTALQGEDK